MGSRYYWSRSGNLVNSVAVLPFVNTNGNPDEEYLCDGITEGLIHSLSQLPQLRVMSRSTAFRYKGRSIDPQTVGRQLKVGAVLVGTLVHHGDNIHLQSELVDARDGSEIWARNTIANFPIFPPCNRKSSATFLEIEIAAWPRRPEKTRDA